MPRTQNTKTITIIGGGLSGLTVFCEQINAYKNAPANAARIDINWIEKSGTFGAGLAYDADDDVFLLNQPAKLMSPFADDPDHFTRWLEKHDAGSDADTFAPRRLYRRYLDELLNSALESAKQSGKITTRLISAEADSLAPETEHGYRITLKSGLALDSDAVILATGHLQNNDLQNKIGGAGYQQSPFYKAGIARELEHASGGTGGTGSIGIIGTGQSMMDALAALHALGTKEKITLFSRDNILPWEFDPKDFGADKPRYQPQFLTTENLTEKSDFAALKSAFAKEVQNAEKTGFTLGHVLVAFDKQAFLQHAQNHPQSAAIKKFVQLIDKYYANPTTPARFRLFQQLRQSGQVEIVRQEVTAENIKRGESGFIIGGKYKVAHLFNSAALRRSAFDDSGRPVDKLARAADDAGLLARNPHDAASIRPGLQNRAGLYVTGPQTNATRWGVESFREISRDAARDAVTYILTLNRKEKHHVKDRNISNRTHRI